MRRRYQPPAAPPRRRPPWREARDTTPPYCGKMHTWRDAMEPRTTPRRRRPMTANSFGSKAALDVAGTSYEIHRLDRVPGAETLPFSLKVLLENLLRTEDGLNVTAEHARALGEWDPAAEPDTEIPFSPARVLMQD